MRSLLASKKTSLLRFFFMIHFFSMGIFYKKLQFRVKSFVARNSFEVVMRLNIVAKANYNNKPYFRAIHIIKSTK